VALAKLNAITQVTRTMGILTIAELVENEETLTKLRAIGVDLAQGFGISSPVPLESVMKPQQVAMPATQAR
jgi:EAL domain-containing protein (putative c-di-GMP-specific phosphodiesterase class I)